MKILLRFLTVVFFLTGSISALHAQPVDSLIHPAPADSALTTSSIPADSTFTADSHFVTTPVYTLNELLKDNTLINFNDKSEAFWGTQKIVLSREFDFYFVLVLFAFLGVLKATSPRYFTNLFRVFFNTSLQQGQLTDQLLQAKLTSLLYNVFFVLSVGFFFYQFLRFEHLRPPENEYKIFLIIIGALALIYIGKYLILKFVGWITGYSHEADTYIFILFLVNKVLGIVLLPLSFIISFSRYKLSHATLILSGLIILLIFLLRFFRSYSNLQPRMQVNRWHFLLYIIGMEILPLLILFKLTRDLL